MIFTGERAVNDSDDEISLRTYPANRFEDAHRESVVRLRDVALLDPVNLPVPLVSEQQWDLCRRIHSAPGVVRLGELPEIVATRGEINQTIFREFITSESKMARLVKGVEIAQYQERTKLSQGEREWFDEEQFLSVQLSKTSCPSKADCHPADHWSG